MTYDRLIKSRGAKAVPLAPVLHDYCSVFTNIWHWHSSGQSRNHRPCVALEAVTCSCPAAAEPTPHAHSLFFTNYTNYLRFKVCKSMHHRTIQINHQPHATIFQHDCHHDTKVKAEAATAVIELLMMGGTMPETCWAVNKRQDNELENCCIRLVIYLNYTNYLM